MAAPYVLEVKRAVAQLLLVSRAGRELLHLSTWFPNPSTERDGSSQLLLHDDPLVAAWPSTTLTPC